VAAGHRTADRARPVDLAAGASRRPFTLSLQERLAFTLRRDRNVLVGIGCQGALVELAKVRLDSLSRSVSCLGERPVHAPPLCRSLG
jgi:hypothetical protein